MGRPPQQGVQLQAGAAGVQQQGRGAPAPLAATTALPGVVYAQPSAVGLHVARLGQQGPKQAHLQGKGQGLPGGQAVLQEEGGAGKGGGLAAALLAAAAASWQGWQAVRVGAAQAQGQGLQGIHLHSAGGVQGVGGGRGGGSWRVAQGQPGAGQAVQGGGMGAACALCAAPGIAPGHAAVPGAPQQAPPQGGAAAAGCCGVLLKQLKEDGCIGVAEHLLQGRPKGH